MPVNKVSPEKVVTAFIKALQSVPDFARLHPTEVGNIVDDSVKSLFEDFMKSFGMKPNQDYVPPKDVPMNAPASDFIVLSKEANDLLECLLEGDIEVCKARLEENQRGKLVKVEAFKK